MDVPEVYSLSFFAASVPSWVAIAWRLLGHSLNSVLRARSICGVVIP